jgi:hypothetical protein
MTISWLSFMCRAAFIIEIDNKSCTVEELQRTSGKFKGAWDIAVVDYTVFVFDSEES